VQLVSFKPHGYISIQQPILTHPGHVV